MLLLLDKNGELDRKEILRLFEADWKQTVAVTLACVGSMLNEKIYGKRAQIANIIETLRKKLHANTTHPAKMVASLLRRADGDGSGTISKAEFMAFSADEDSRLQVQTELQQLIQSLAGSLEPDLTRELQKIL